jgi:hypothetical protein
MGHIIMHGQADLLEWSGWRLCFRYLIHIVTSMSLFCSLYRQYPQPNRTTVTHIGFETEEMSNAADGEEARPSR